MWRGVESLEVGIDIKYLILRYIYEYKIFYASGVDGWFYWFLISEGVHKRYFHVGFDVYWGGFFFTLTIYIPVLAWGQNRLSYDYSFVSFCTL